MKIAARHLHEILRILDDIAHDLSLFGFVSLSDLMSLSDLKEHGIPVELNPNNKLSNQDFMLCAFNYGWDSISEFKISKEKGLWWLTFPPLKERDPFKDAEHMMKIFGL